VAEAELVRGRLGAAGFHAELVNDLAALSIDGYTQAAGGVLVQVPEDEAVSARELITGEESPTP
jgi:hypothetical protein